MDRSGLARRARRCASRARSIICAPRSRPASRPCAISAPRAPAYADVELKQAVNQGIVPGPRILASTRAIVATGSYQPKFIAEWSVPQGAEEADGVDSLTRVVRDQIGKGADWIKMYADYRWGPLPGSRPTFSIDELKLAVETAKSAGVPVAVHANTAEGHAARGAGRRRDDRPRRRGHARGLQADGRASRRAVPDDHRRRRPVAAGRSRTRRRRSASAPASRRRSTRASRS